MWELCLGVSQECCFFDCKVKGVALEQEQDSGYPLSRRLETEAEPQILILVSKEFFLLSLVVVTVEV